MNRIIINTLYAAAAAFIIVSCEKDPKEPEYQARPYCTIADDNMNLPCGGTLRTDYSDAPKGCEIDMLIDGDVSTYYQTNHQTVSLLVNAAKAIAVENLSLVSSPDSPEYDPAGFKLLGSNDNKTWEKIAEKKGFSFETRSQMLTWDIKSGVAYRYIKLNITANNGGEMLKIAEMALSEAVPDSIDDLMHLADTDEGESKSATFTYAGTDFPERTEPTIYEFQYPAEGKAALAEQEGTKENLRKYHFMTAEVLANDEYPLGARALKFNTQVAIVKLSLNNEDFKGQVVKDVALAVNGEPAYVATEEFVGSEDAGEVVVYLAVEPGSLSGCKVLATCGEKVYDASLENNTLVAGALYRVTKEVSTEDAGGDDSGDDNGDDPVVKEYTDLSADNKTANCYIVSAAGDYKFQAVKGNTTTALTVTSVEVLWESFGTTTAPAVGALVSTAQYEDGYVQFTASDKKGNAVIAAKNGDAIVWSWHIWMTDAPAEQKYGDYATFLDRNLGATSANKNDGAATHGLLYQYGRKDPFMGFVDPATETRSVSTGTWSTEQNKTTNAADYTVDKPMTFMTATSSIVSSDYKTRWSDSEKTMYDPCPAGYRLPTKDSWGGYDASTKNKLASDCYNASGVTKMGWGLYEVAVWYPQAGQLNKDMTTHKTECVYWTSTVASNGWIRALSLQPASDDVKLKGLNSSWTLHGAYIRCVKE